MNYHLTMVPVSGLMVGIFIGIAATTTGFTSGLWFAGGLIWLLNMALHGYFYLEGKK